MNDEMDAATVEGRLFMNTKRLYGIWLVAFVICACLGFLPAPAGAAAVLCMILAVAFFVPPVLIVYRSWKNQDWENIRLVRNLAMGSLFLTLVILIGNFFTLTVPEWVGDALYAVLVIVSTPMVCGQIWVISLLLWAALRWTCILLLSKKK